MKIKFLTPLAVAVTAITPVATIVASCGNKNDITVDKKEITSGDSYTSYKFKLPSVPTDKKVTINIINKSADQEQVYFDPDLVQTTNSYLNTAEFTTDDQGNVEVPVCYMLAPTQSSSSQFGLTFTYNNQSVTQTVSDLKFDYNVDYDVDLKAGDYDPSKLAAPAPATHWTQQGKTAGQIYMEDCEANSKIYQSDARYSTSLNIKKAIDASGILNLNSFKAYFNDIYRDDKGLNVHMNYEIKSNTGSKFEFTKYNDPLDPTDTSTYTYNNFNVSFTLETEVGYQFTQDQTQKNLFIISDSTNNYHLVGRFNGKFDCKVVHNKTSTTAYEKTNAEYNGVIKNYDWRTNETTDQDVAYMLAFGIIHLTYDFDWATPIPKLKLISSFAKNA